MTTLLFTDLDGSLLDCATYSWEAAKPALARLQNEEIPMVFVTSKTRAEVEPLRRRMGNTHPFIVENGGAAFIPHGYFPFPVPATHSRDGYDVIEWGVPYARLISDLQTCARASRCRINGFHQMTCDQVAACCNLPWRDASLAKQREYDEAFEILDPKRSDHLFHAIEERRLQWTQGGRFYHVCGDNDKAIAVEALKVLYGKVHRKVLTFGIGDGLNDARFLEAVDHPVIIRSPFTAELSRRVPRATVTEIPGPNGWNEAVLRMIAS